MTNDVLPIVVWDDADAATRSRVLTRNGLAGALSVRTEFGASISSLLDDVRADGDAALVQIGAPAVAAGVERIAVVVPPVPGGAGRVDPATLVAADLLGLGEV